MRRHRRTRRLAPAVEGLPRILPLDGAAYELPAIEDIFAPEPAPEDLIPPPLPDDPFLDSLPRFVPLGPAPPDLEDGQPPFVPLPPAPTGPSGPA